MQADVGTSGQMMRPVPYKQLYPEEEASLLTQVH